MVDWNKVLRFAGLGVALWVGLFVLLMLAVQIAGWWTGKGAAYYWP